MRTDAQATHVPLPFTTAALGLCLSYLFRAQIHPVLSTVVGFAIGVLLLYFASDPRTVKDAKIALAQPIYSKKPSRGKRTLPMGAGDLRDSGVVEDIRILREEVQRIRKDYDLLAYQQRLLTEARER